MKTSKSYAGDASTRERDQLSEQTPCICVQYLFVFEFQENSKSGVKYSWKVFKFQFVWDKGSSSFKVLDCISITLAISKEWKCVLQYATLWMISWLMYELWTASLEKQITCFGKQHYFFLITNKRWAASEMFSYPGFWVVDFNLGSDEMADISQAN